jgi:anti-sigma factor RsiW
MKSPSATHDWLKRVSDYHSGSVGDAERAAVEAHLATCQQCQEAFAMYRRFYSLLRSPLRLGPPSLHFDGDTDFGDATTRPVARANSLQSHPPYESSPSYPPNQSYPPTRPPQRSRRSRALAGVAAVVAATIVVAGFLALYAAHGTRPPRRPRRRRTRRPPCRRRSQPRRPQARTARRRPELSSAPTRLDRVSRTSTGAAT